MFLTQLIKEVKRVNEIKEPHDCLQQQSALCVQEDLFVANLTPSTLSHQDDSIHSEPSTSNQRELRPRVKKPKYTW